MNLFFKTGRLYQAVQDEGYYVCYSQSRKSEHCEFGYWYASGGIILKNNDYIFCLEENFYKLRSEYLCKIIFLNHIHYVENKREKWCQINEVL